MSVAYYNYAAGNNISDTVSSSVGAGDTTLPMNNISLWPNKAFKVIIDRGLTSQEIIAVSGISGSSLTVTGRGQESTTGVGHNAGATVESVPFAGDWNNVIDTLKNGFLAATGAIDTTKLVDLTTAQTLTNKRGQKRVDSQTSTNTITPEISTYDIFVRTAQAHDLVINNHSTSTPEEGELMLFEITSDATPRALTYGNKYLAKAGTALPTTTVASKTLTMLFKWSAGLAGWNLLAVGQES